MSNSGKKTIIVTTTSNLEARIDQLSVDTSYDVKRTDLLRVLIEEGLHAAEEPRAAAPEEEQQ